ncbi:hypothetical protein B0H13DRAFT_2486273 [Mycena leptocephala]|nr:hypothetical protein B0H13DRAFT_2486273 [Mycena leptocephala]
MICAFGRVAIPMHSAEAHSGTFPPSPTARRAPGVSACAGVAWCGESAASTIAFGDTAPIFCFYSGQRRLLGSFFISSILLLFFIRRTFIPSLYLSPPSISYWTSKPALTRFVYRSTSTDRACTGVASAFSPCIEEVESTERALVSSAIHGRRVAHPPGSTRKRKGLLVLCDERDGHDEHRTHTTPPPPTAATRPCIYQRNGQAIRVCERVLRSCSASYDDRQREYDEGMYKYYDARPPPLRRRRRIPHVPKSSPQYLGAPVSVQQAASVHQVRAFALGLVRPLPYAFDISLFRPLTGRGGRQRPPAHNRETREPSGEGVEDDGDHEQGKGKGWLGMTGGNRCVACGAGCAGRGRDCCTEALSYLWGVIAAQTCPAWLASHARLRVSAARWQHICLWTMTYMPASLAGEGARRVLVMGRVFVSRRSDAGAQECCPG